MQCWPTTGWISHARSIAKTWIDWVSLIVFGNMFIVPFIFIFLTVAKTRQEASLFQFSWPSKFQLFENIRDVIVYSDYSMIRALWNSTLLTVGSVTLIILFQMWLLSRSRLSLCSC